MLGFLRKAVTPFGGSSQKKSGGSPSKTIIGRAKKEDNSAKMRVFNPSASNKPVNDSAERAKSRNSGMIRSMVGNAPEPKKMRIGGFRKN